MPFRNGSRIPARERITLSVCLYYLPKRSLEQYVNYRILAFFYPPVNVLKFKILCEVHICFLTSGNQIQKIFDIRPL
jgi:hypothetical protein